MDSVRVKSVGVCGCFAIANGCGKYLREGSATPKRDLDCRTLVAKILQNQTSKPLTLRAKMTNHTGPVMLLCKQCVPFQRRSHLSKETPHPQKWVLRKMCHSPTPH